MMKECKHKNIVAYFGSYHRCCVFPARRPLMCGIPGIVGGLNYEECDFYFPHTAAGFLSHSFLSLGRLLAPQLVNDTLCISGSEALAAQYQGVFAPL